MIASRNRIAVGGALGQTASVDTRRPCPCCGHLVFDVRDGWPGSYSICPVCFWEDDLTQIRWPFVLGGANRVPLVEAQQNFQHFGACDQRSLRSVRPPADDEPLDANWRPIDPVTDSFENWESEEHRPWPEDDSVLLWWLPSFQGVPEDLEPDAGRRVVVDVGSVRGECDLHAVLKRDLGFPSFYGMNWDAFWDAITGLVEMPGELRFVHWAELEHRVPQDASALRRQLARYSGITPAFKVVYVTG